MPCPDQNSAPPVEAWTIPSLPASATGVDYTYTRPVRVNKCETFEIVGSFFNKTSEDLTNVVACIYWKGNAYSKASPAENQIFRIVKCSR